MRTSRMIHVQVKNQTLAKYVGPQVSDFYFNTRFEYFKQEVMMYLITFYYI